MLSGIVEKTLKNCSDAELYVKRLEDYPVVFEANNLKSVKSRLMQGFSLRAIKDSRLGFASSTNIANGKDDDLIKSAISSSKYGPLAEYSFWNGKRFPAPNVFHPATVSFEIEEAESMGRHIVKRLLETIPEAYIDVKLGRSFEEVTHITSSYERVYYKSLFYLFVTALLVRDGQLLYLNEGTMGCGIPEKPFSLIGEIAWKEKLSQNSVEVASKKMPVIFTPKTVSLLLEPLVSGLSGRTVASKSSPLTGRIEEQILDERFSLYDDALMDLAIESSPFDDEGVPRQRFPLFNKGILKNYFLDLATAHALGLESTASASRAFLMPPVAGPSNLQVEPGDISYDEMIEDMEEGLIVDQVIGGGQSNLLGGEFSVNVELGFLVKKGKIVGKVRNTMVAGNAYELLKNNILAIGKDSERVDNIVTPHICIKDMSVSGKG